MAARADDRFPAQVWVDDLISASVVPYFTLFWALHQLGAPLPVALMLLLGTLVLATLWGLEHHFG